MEGAGRQITAAAVFALSGCSLFLLSYLIRDKVRAVAFSVKPTTTTSTQRFISSAKRGWSSAVIERPRKQVRFLQVEDETKKPGKAITASNAMRKSNQKIDDQTTVRGEKKQRVNLPQNWRSLYNGISRYRSQQATLIMYA